MNTPSQVPGESSPLEVFPEPTREELLEAGRPAGVKPDAWESEVDEAVAQLRRPESPSRPANGLFFLLLVLFVLWGPGGSFAETLVLLGIILFHELGHLVAMRLLGYRDTRIFFIPFLGGVALGREENGSQFKRALVALAGPLPGIVLAAIALFLWNRHGFPQPVESWRHAALSMLILNGVNLLPILPLDGGHFWNAVLFARNPWAETICKIIAGCIFALAGYFGGYILFLLIGLFMLLTITVSHQVSRVSFQLRKNGMTRGGAALRDLDFAELLKLYLRVRGERPTVMSRVALLERAYAAALPEVVPLRGALSLVLLYVLAFGLILAAAT